MSLQVWLPLNGNLNNNGTNTANITSSGTMSYDSSGKIGKAFVSGSVNISIPINFSTNELSIACWVKPSSPGAWTNIFSLGSGDNRLEVSNTNWYYFYANSEPLIANGTSLFEMVSGTWYHVAFTADGSNVRIYLNGNLVKTVTQTNTIRTAFGSNFKITIGSRIAGNQMYSGRINDVRVYDNCLSTKEVKEISKGLVLHYKLTGHGSDNLFVDSHFDSRYQVTAWDTSKNGSYCASNWGGYNGGVGNPSTVYHAHLELKDNEYVYNYTKDANNSWLGISPSIGSYISAGSTYTFSCEVLRISGTNYPNGGIHTKASSTATSWSFVTWYDFSAFSSIPTDGKWHKYASTMTVPSGTDLSGGASFYIYGHSGGNGTFLMRHPKLEAGSVSTSWCVRSSDGIYSTLSANRSVEYDLSGNKYNGTKSGNISALDSSPRYNSCTYMRASDAKIRTTLTTSGFANSFTISWWSNISDMTGKMAWGFSDGNRLNVYPTTYFCWNTGDGGDNPFKNNGTRVSYSPYNGAWHHYAVTGNGSTNILYIDGKEVGRSTTYKGITGSTIYISGWDSGSSYTWSGGSISDFRIYSTVLSASDIKELYNSPIKISKNGTMMCSEIEELP